MSFRIEPVHNDYHAVFHGDRKVGIIFPALPVQSFPPAPAQPWQLAPNPEAFPDAGCAGLPAPMRPWFMDFPSLEAIEAFLGIEAGAEAA